MFHADGFEDFRRHDDDFPIAFGTGITEDFNAALKEILAIGGPAKIFPEYGADIAEFEELVGPGKFPRCRFDERYGHIGPQDQDPAVRIDGLDHLLAQLGKVMLVYIIIFKTRRFDDFAAVIHDDRHEFPLDAVIIPHFIVMEHLDSIQCITEHLYALLAYYVFALFLYRFTKVKQ